MDSSGCIVTKTLTIQVKKPCIGDESELFVANIFSPDNDGKKGVTGEIDIREIIENQSSSIIEPKLKAMTAFELIIKTADEKSVSLNYNQFSKESIKSLLKVL